ncbi:EF-hand calcium-binding domain-containing protein 6-like [Spea bombifrons]|uniref:EF-hand calcium-binding domain-containing protein 6-like n=1 Tax=Spea bombifrons TaxID=233779 RepID=UPI00234A7F74|nr:EF-hand calcium-binding domain-containing protein 6-like [Spea bombifrons]
MTEKEFRKLWNRYVGDGGRVLSSDHLLSQLGVVNSRNADDHRSALLSALQKVSGSHRNPQPQTSKAAPSKRADERKLSLSIERWLKENFREGARAMAAEFGALDPEKKGKVSKDDFLTVLDRFNLHLAKDQLAHFLARCGIDESSPSVNYLEFLRRSQSRSKNGVSNQIWGHGAYRLENRNPSRSRSASGVFEEKLIPLLHSDFVSLLHAFQRADPKQLNVISQQDFRTIIEQKYAIKVTEEEFAGLLEKLPVDHRGGIRYLEFMSRFDGSDGRLSLFDGGRTVLTEYSKKPNNPIKTRDPQKGRSAEQVRL